MNWTSEIASLAQLGGRCKCKNGEVAENVNQ